MKAVVFDNGLKLENNYPMPEPKAGEALIKVTTIGICNTDYEITKGYMGYKGILGHEFTGIVEKAKNKELVGKRVVGEINCGCGECEWCAQGLERHCFNRSTLGIWKREGGRIPPQSGGIKGMTRHGAARRFHGPSRAVSAGCVSGCDFDGKRGESR